MPVKRVDISQPKPIENQGKKNEIGLIGTQRLMFAGYWEWDLKTGKYGWCDEMYRIFKLLPQQPLRTGTFFNSIHPEDRGKVVKALGKALVGEEPFNIQHRIVCPDGEVRSVHGKAEVSFEGGIPVRVLGTVQEITDTASPIYPGRQ
jgi:two-component system, sensor histidine kinase PdtaS